MINNFKNISIDLVRDYNKKTPQLASLLDVHMIICILAFLLCQFYKYFLGKREIRLYPMASLYCVGSCVLTSCLRLCMFSKTEIRKVTNKRLLLEYILCHILMFCAIFVFLQ